MRYSSEGSTTTSTTTMAGSRVWASEHIDSDEEPTRDGSWHTRYAKWSVVVEDYSDEHGYATHTTYLMADVDTRFPSHFFPPRTWSKAKSKLDNVDWTMMSQ